MFKQFAGRVTGGLSFYNTMKTKPILLLPLALLVLSCSEIQPDKEQSLQTEGICVSVSAPDFVFGDDTKSSLSTSGDFTWSAGDRIGIYSNQIGASTQTPSHLALTLAAGEGTSTASSSTTGWSLIPGNTFNYFSYYPYSGDNSREQIFIDYSGQTQSDIGAYDYMYSDMAFASSATSASFSFHHIGCLVNVNITVPSGYENTTFYKMRLYADSELFTSSASYSVNDVATSGTPSFDREMCDGIQLSFGDTGIKPKDGVINAWLMMYPAQWKGRTITAKLYAAKNNISSLAGTFTPSANQTAGIPYAYSVTSSATGQTLPDKPTSGEQLHILLFGHSFGIDCTEYLPDITKAAGITDVHYGRFIQGNCQLLQHWNHITAKDTYQYDDSNPASTEWTSVNRKVDDVLAQYPWDVILFQQNIGFSGEGSYSSYQPHLNYLTHYVDSFCTEIHGGTPIIGWNMFWGFNSQVFPLGGAQYSTYDIDATEMYESIVVATQAMVADKTKANEINLIVPAGTAIQNARGTSLNEPGSATSPSTTYLLTRDGYHASYGIGRYVTACTWFQKLIAPIYGVDITGNTYRPTRTAFKDDLVTDARAAICWKCAKAAVEHPYVVSTIDETTP